MCSSAASRCGGAAASASTRPARATTSIYISPVHRASGLESRRRRWTSRRRLHRRRRLLLDDRQGGITPLACDERRPPSVGGHARHVIRRQPPAMQKHREMKVNLLEHLPKDIATLASTTPKALGAGPRRACQRRPRRAPSTRTTRPTQVHCRTRNVTGDHRALRRCRSRRRRQPRRRRIRRRRRRRVAGRYGASTVPVWPSCRSWNVTGRLTGVTASPVWPARRNATGSA